MHKPPAKQTVSVANPKRTRIESIEQINVPEPDAPETTRAA